VVIYPTCSEPSILFVHSPAQSLVLWQILLLRGEHCFPFICFQKKLVPLQRNNVSGPAGHVCKCIKIVIKDAFLNDIFYAFPSIRLLFLSLVDL